MHYKDGTEAKVGDLVKGTTYNTPKGSIQVGILLGITPGSDSCNARVLLPVVKPAGDNSLPFPSMVTAPGGGSTGAFPYVTHVMADNCLLDVHREGVQYKDGAQTAGTVVFTGHRIDYTACGDLELVHRPE